MERYYEQLRTMGFEVSQDEAVARIEFDDVLARMREHRLKKLGQPVDYPLEPTVDRSDQLVQAESVLTDPIAQLTVSSSGRGDRGMKRELAAWVRLILARDVLALRRVLRGPNPEGRAYAALALNELGELSADDLTVIDVLKTTPDVWTGRGCMRQSVPARQFFEDLTKPN